MSKDPAFLFYSSDFLTGTMLFTDEQVGKYIRLLCLQHQRGRLEERHVLSICKEYDEDIFEKFIKDENGLYYNKRLEVESKKRASYTKSRRKNLKKDDNSDYSGSHMGEHMEPHMNSHMNSHMEKHMEPHMENENENENINRNIDNNKNKKKKDKISLFDEFWGKYPKKKSKGEAEKAWKAIKPDRELVSTMLKKLEQATTCREWLEEGGRFIPYPATWLRAKGWEDEYLQNSSPASDSGYNFDEIQQKALEKQLSVLEGKNE